jgi:predicted MFS family arabinose efflux permease
MKDSMIATPGQPAMYWRGWTGRQISVLATLILVNIFNAIDRGILSILQQPIKEDLLLSDWQLGILSGPAFAALYSVAGVPIARLADRGNRSLILAIAVSFWSMMTALCGLAQSYIHLLLCRIGVGGGEGACTPTTHALISSHFSARQRGFAMAVLTTSIPIAQMLAPLLGGYATAMWGWRTAFLIAGLPGLLVAVLVFFVLREQPGEEDQERKQAASGSYWANVKQLLSYRPYLFLCLASVFMGQALSTTNAFSASFFMRQHGFTVAEAGWVMAAGLGIAGFTGTMLGGYLSDRFAGQHGRSYTYVCALAAALGATFFFLTFRVESAALAVVFVLLANVSTDLKNGPNFAAAQNLAPPHMRATASAFMMVGVHLIGSSSGPVILGLVSDSFAAGAFPEALGDFAQQCHGALESRPQAVIDGCAEASAYGLGKALIIPCISYCLSALFFFASGRTTWNAIERQD